MSNMVDMTKWVQYSPSARFLEHEGIIAQYTIPETLQQNGVAERQNRMLMDMVRCMVSSTKLNFHGVKH